jgi:hypothetical protein
MSRGAKRLRFWLKPLSLAILGVAIVGCSDGKLETGYKPKLLNMSTDEERALYADPFTAESHAGENEQQSEMRARKPGSY